MRPDVDRDAYFRSRVKHNKHRDDSPTSESTSEVVVVLVLDGVIDRRLHDDASAFDAADQNASRKTVSTSSASVTGFGL